MLGDGILVGIGVALGFLIVWPPVYMVWFVLRTDESEGELE